MVAKTPKTKRQKSQKAYPKSPSRKARNGKRGQGKQLANGSNVSALSTVKGVGIRLGNDLCPCCLETFEKRRRNQIYCTGNCRRIACERRKEALITAVHDLLRWRGIHYEQIANAIEIALKAFQKAIRALGYTYDEFRKKWVTDVIEGRNAV